MTPQFPYLDYRSRMPRAKWSIGTRSATLFFTIHYNGPSVKAAGNPAGEIAQLQFDAAYHMRPGALGSPIGGDGIQYHGATLSNGINLQLRDWLAKLWHCGNATGNAQSVAWHIPIGGTQQPTNAQLHQLYNVVIPAFQREYRFVYTNVKGHREWKQTDCPGIPLFNSLMDWRANHATPAPLMWYKTLANVYVRESPEIQPNLANVALDGTALIAKDTVFAVDELKQGVPYTLNGITVSQYVHRADGLGFMLNHPDLLQKQA